MSDYAWESVTDDDFPHPTIASRVLDAMRDWGAGQSEMSGYADEEGTDKQWTVAVVDGPLPFAVHVDWRTHEVIAATLADHTYFNLGAVNVDGEDIACGHITEGET